MFLLLQNAAGWLTPRRIRAHAILLAVCMWSAVAVDFAVPGMMDRAGNIKFQDFLQFYVAGKQIAQGNESRLYDPQILLREMEVLVGHPTDVRLPTVYGPQVGLFFSPFSRFSFLNAARLWVLISVALYFLCSYLLWRVCPALQSSRGLIALLVLAFPPFFHFVVRGQICALLLVCFVGALYAFRAGHDWLGGFCLGSLVFKPQFLIAIGIIFLAARAGQALIGFALAIFAQLGFTWAFFGFGVMHRYIGILLRIGHFMAIVEPGPSLAQMHSLRSFWWLLVPWPALAWSLYLLSCAAVLTFAVACWRSPGPLPLRYSALILAAILVNPHLFVYDLLVLAPALFLLADWSLQNPVHPAAPALRVFLYLAYLLPLFGPLALWTRLQLSVLAFVALQWLLWQILREQQLPDPAIAAASV
jgi:Glycosyltransferase family 87